MENEGGDEEDCSTQATTDEIELAVYQKKPETPCQKIYQRACAKLQVIPSMAVYDHLPCTQMVLPHSGVNQEEVKAIAIALVVSSKRTQISVLT